MNLPADIARCHDDQCEERESCRRWTERDTDHPNCSHVQSAFQEEE